MATIFATIQYSILIPIINIKVVTVSQRKSIYFSYFRRSVVSKFLSMNRPLIVKNCELHLFGLGMSCAIVSTCFEPTGITFKCLRMQEIRILGTSPKLLYCVTFCVYVCTVPYILYFKKIIIKVGIPSSHLSISSSLMLWKQRLIDVYLLCGN